MTKQDKLNSIIPLYNGISSYWLYLNKVCQNEQDITELTDEKDLNIAMFGLVALSLVFSKEKFIKNNGNLDYESLIDDEKFDEYIQMISTKVSNGFKIDNYTAPNAATLFSVIRNKIAHGDFYLTEDKENIVLNKITDDIATPMTINIKKLEEFYSTMLRNYDHNKKENKYELNYLENKTLKAIKKPLKTAEEIKEVLPLLKYRKFTLQKMDGSLLTPEEKETFHLTVLAIRNEEQYNLNQKTCDTLLRKHYLELGCNFSVENKKIKDSAIVEKITDSILKQDYETDNVDLLVDRYGEDIIRILDEDYKNRSIIFGSIVNDVILKELKSNNSNDFNKMIDNQDFKTVNAIVSSLNELIASIDIARFLTLYSYPLDDFYKTGKTYHANRSEEFDFGSLDLSELNPSIIEIDDSIITEKTNLLKNIAKDITKINENLLKKTRNFNGLSNKGASNEKERKALEDLKSSVEKLNTMLELKTNEYLEESAMLEYIKNDFKNNSNYFRNRAIVEGIRNSVAHGSVTLENLGDVKYLRDTKIKFTNFYDGKVRFQMTSTLREFELLFEDINREKTESFIKKEDTKIKKLSIGD